MPKTSTGAFQHLTKEGVIVHNLEPLALSAIEVQAYLQEIPDTRRRRRTATEFYRQLDLSEFALAERFQQTFAVDAATLPEPIGKLLVHYALTASLPGQDPCPPSQDLPQVIGGLTTARGLALLQEPETATEGVGLLHQVAALLDLS